MTDGVRTALGAWRLVVRAASPEQVLSRLSREKLRFWAPVRRDDFTAEATVAGRDLARARAAVTAAQGEVLSETPLGLLRLRPLFRRRKAFLAAVAAILLSVQVLTGYVWCLRVEGNEAVPDEAILRQLAELGVGFGTRGRDIVSQDLKNRVLAELPQLEWLTVNRSGGLATVVVRERLETPAVLDRRMVTNLVAVRDCLVTEMQVLSGQAVRQVGDTVRAGELLVSGYADLEHCTQATRSLGEVYGRTWRRQEAVTPAQAAWQLGVGETHRRYALLLGRRRINFYKTSGIWGSGCDKMIVYHQLTLPGGYTFPVTLVEEIAVEREQTAETLTPAHARQLLETGTAAAVQASMVAGELLREDVDVQREGALYRLRATYECREMVAREVPARFTESEGTTWQNG